MISGKQNARKSRTAYQVDRRIKIERMPVEGCYIVDSSRPYLNSALYSTLVTVYDMLLVYDTLWAQEK